MLIEQGVEREVRAIQSARVFAAADRNALQKIDELARRMSAKTNELMPDLETVYRQLHGSNPKPIALNAEEQAATRKVPANVASLADYFDRRNNVDFDGGLHTLMFTEVFNFVDGRRSYYDIYKAVYAESQAAGSWYYGTVTLKDVVALLDAGVKAKALTLK
jgi:hypothetical protein